MSLQSRLASFISAVGSDIKALSTNKADKTDPRFTDARTPTAHNHDDLYYTETEANSRFVNHVEQGSGSAIVRLATNALTWQISNAATSPGIVIDLGHDFSYPMMRVHIKGFAYVAGGKAIIDYVVGYYAYDPAAPKIANSSFVNNGSYPGSMSIMKKISDDTVSLLLLPEGGITSTWSYPKLTVDILAGHTAPSESVLGNVSVSMHDLTSLTANYVILTTATLPLASKEGHTHTKANITDFAHTLESHSNVVSTAPATGDAIIYNGTSWDNRKLTVSDLPTTVFSESHLPTWSEVSGKPSTFAPSAHTLESHSNVVSTAPVTGDAIIYNGTTWDNRKLAVGDLPSTVFSESHLPTWSEVSGKPSTFAPTIGSTSTTAVAGNDSRLTNSRTPTGTAGGDLSGTYPNPSIKAASTPTNATQHWTGTGNVATTQSANIVTISTSIGNTAAIAANGNVATTPAAISNPVGYNVTIVVSNASGAVVPLNLGTNGIITAPAGLPIASGTSRWRGTSSYAV